MNFRNEKELQETLMQFLEHQGYRCKQEIITKGGGRLDILAQRDPPYEELLLIECKHILNARSIKDARLQVNDYFISYPSAKRVIAGLSTHKNLRCSKESARKADSALKKAKDQGIWCIILDQYPDFVSWYDNTLNGDSFKQELYAEVSRSSPQTTRLRQVDTEFYKVDPKYKIEYFPFSQDKTSTDFCSRNKESVSNHSREQETISSLSNPASKNTIDSTSSQELESGETPKVSIPKKQESFALGNSAIHSKPTLSAPTLNLLAIGFIAIFSFLYPSVESLLLKDELSISYTENLSMNEDDNSIARSSENSPSLQTSEVEEAAGNLSDRLDNNSTEYKDEVVGDNNEKISMAPRGNVHSKDVQELDQFANNGGSSSMPFSEPMTPENTGSALDGQNYISRLPNEGNHIFEMDSPASLGVSSERISANGMRDVSADQTDFKEPSEGREVDSVEPVYPLEGLDQNLARGIRTKFPLDSCGDETVDSKIRYRIYTQEKPLKLIQEAYCNDAFYRADGRIQIASFKDKRQADQLSKAIPGSYVEIEEVLPASAR